MSKVYFDPAIGGDGSSVSDDADPDTGLQDYGWTVRFIPCFIQQVAIGRWLVQKVSDTRIYIEDALQKCADFLQKVTAQADRAEEYATAVEHAPEALNQQVTRIYALAVHSDITRNSNGEIIKIVDTLIDGSSRVMEYTRDTDGYVTQVVTTAGGFVRTETFDHDADGFITDINAQEDPL